MDSAVKLHELLQYMECNDLLENIDWKLGCTCPRWSSDDNTITR